VAALFPKSLGKRSRLSDSERKIEIERQRDRQAKPNKECFNLYLFLSAGNHRVSPFHGESLHVAAN